MTKHEKWDMSQKRSSLKRFWAVTRTILWMILWIHMIQTK